MVTRSFNEREKFENNEEGDILRSETPNFGAAVRQQISNGKHAKSAASLNKVVFE